jgi:hypothetical protein
MQEMFGGRGLAALSGGERRAIVQPVRIVLLVIVVAAIALAAGAAVYGCAARGHNHGDRENDDDDDSRGDGDPECETGAWPQILNVAVVVNGAVVEPPVVAEESDALVLRVSYRDLSCDLDHGHAALENQSTDELTPIDAPEGSFLGLGCSSAEAGAPLVLEVEVAAFQNLGGATMALLLFDRCGNPSAPWPLEIATVGD